VFNVTTIEITADYDAMSHISGTPAKHETGTDLYVGKWYVEQWRTGVRFPLATLPSGKNVTKVRVKIYVNAAGGAASLVDIHPYNGDGQADPDTDDDPAVFYPRCAAGTEYVNDSIEGRTTGEKWFTLGDGESAQACIDVENAKSAVNRFSVGFHEEGDNDAGATLDSLEKSGGIPAVLEITYEEPTPPVGYSYSDGLVSVQVAG